MTPAPKPHDEEITRMWLAGHSLTEIGDRLGVSKNAIAGRKNRLDLPKRGLPVNFQVARTPGQRQTLLGANWTRPPERQPEPPPAPRPAPAAVSPVGASKHCEWVESERAPYNRCGKRAAYGTSWCDEHGLICFRVWPPARVV